MDFSDIIYRNNNYVKNLHATDNNENENIIFIQQFYIPKQFHLICQSTKWILVYSKCLARNCLLEYFKKDSSLVRCENLYTLRDSFLNYQKI